MRPLTLVRSEALTKREAFTAGVTGALLLASNVFPRATNRDEPGAWREFGGLCGSLIALVIFAIWRLS